ncbi:MAG TPA: serine/threonine-protein kinase, partial [Candidatus Eisenbacteria bacterium]|nr:serine/threonine-protein kinase [Candidatus Eisenbacteria bacterium]
MTPERLSHYRLLAPLGAGGMGVVYRAHDERLERDVALKLLNAESLADPALRERFRRTALAVARITHPRVGTVFDFGSDQGQDFLVMELVPGESLAARLARGPLPTAEATAIATQIAEALEASHELGIVHRDLKPANVMVSARGQVKVLDFELARLLEAGADVTRSTSGVVRGSPAYMAPEQILGAPVDARADLWALGVIMHEMVTGRPPFAGANIATLALAITQQPAPPPAGAPPAL